MGTVPYSLPQVPKNITYGDLKASLLRKLLLMLRRTIFPITRSFLSLPLGIELIFFFFLQHNGFRWWVLWLPVNVRCLLELIPPFWGISSYHCIWLSVWKGNNGVLALFSERQNRLEPSTRTTGYVLVFAYYIILNHNWALFLFKKLYC